MVFRVKKSPVKCLFDVKCILVVIASHSHHLTNRNGKSHFEITCPLRNGHTRMEEEYKRNVNQTDCEDYVSNCWLIRLFKQSLSSLSPLAILTSKI